MNGSPETVSFDLFLTVKVWLTNSEHLHGLARIQVTLDIEQLAGTRP